MFGMLDYRAHKLYLIIFGIPLFIINWFFILGVPFASYFVAKSYADSWGLITLYSILAYFVFQIISMILGLLIYKLMDFLFSLLIDIIPANGRNKEQAKLVAYGGEMTASIIDLNNTNPKDWTDDQIENVTKGFFNSFYRISIIDRLDFIRSYQQEHCDYVSNEYNNEKLLAKNNLSISILEKIVVNRIWRCLIIGGILFLYLVLFQPSF